MNKKSIVLFFSVLVLLSLGVYYVMATVTGSITKTNDGGVTASLTVVPETINLTATFASHTAPIKNVTFELGGAGTYYDINIVHDNGTFVDDASFGDADPRWTYLGGIMLSTAAEWNCTNISTSIIACLNNTVSDLGPANTTLMVTVNFTGKASTEASNTLTFTGVDTADGYVTDTETLITDDLVPRLLSLNVTDGKTVIVNGSLSGVEIPQLSTYGTDGWTVKALISDYLAEGKAVLGYTCQGAGDTTIIFESTNASAVDATTTTSPVKYIEGTIPYTCFNQTAGDQVNVTFSILVNDSYNQWVMLGDVENTNNFTVSGTYDLLRINRVNITTTTGSTTVTRSATTTNTELDGTSDYLSVATATIDVEVEGAPKDDNSDGLYMLWNDTGAATTNIVNTYGTGLAISNLEYTARTNFSGLNLSSAAGTGAIVYSTSFPLSGNTSSNNFAFWIVANTTGNNNYTAIGGPYRFNVDSSAPTVTVTPPSDVAINPSDSVTFTCAGVDNEAGVNSYKWELQRPGESYTTKLDYSSTASIIFSGNLETNLFGTYTVRCSVKDAVGNEGTDTDTFTVSSSVSTGDTSGGISGGVASIDLSTSEEVTISEKQGVISTFTLDGTTVHTITIKTVDEVAGTVTIIIESDPIEITLKIGETKEVDIDADGTNDISVTLNKITNGVADITTKRLTPLPAEEVPTEEVPPTEKPAEEITPTPEAASKTWLWILIIVVLVVIGVGYWFMKRK